jgi:hypothetical protein
MFDSTTDTCFLQQQSNVENFSIFFFFCPIRWVHHWW